MVDVTASTLTIIRSVFSLAHCVKEVIEEIRERDENARILEQKAETLATILDQIIQVYGPEEGQTYTTSQHRIRRTVRTVVLQCGKDLIKFEEEVRSLHTGNWVNAVWRKNFAAPVFAMIEKSMADHQQHLQMLVTLLHGCQLSELLQLVQKLANPSLVKALVTTGSVGQVADSDSIISQVTTLLGGAESESLHVHDDSDTDTIEHTSEVYVEKVATNYKDAGHGAPLLQAIKVGDDKAVNSLLHESGTHLKEKDSRCRGPLLLAASLGRPEMVNILLAKIIGQGADTKHGGANLDLAFPNAAKPSTSERRDCEKKFGGHCAIDLNARDKLGRTALHYCAEFGMHDQANLLLDLGADVNAKEENKNGYPPAYYAAKNRKYNTTMLLLKRGATTDFRWPTSTSSEVLRLLRNPLNIEDTEPKPISQIPPSRHNSLDPTSTRKISSFVLRRLSCPSKNP